jgi:hypothetical protein
MSRSTSRSDGARRTAFGLLAASVMFLAGGHVVEVQAPSAPPRDQYVALDAALARLKTSTPAQPTADLEQRLAELRESRGGPCRLDTLCARLWQLITERAAKASLRSEVHVETTGGPGASVRYQTIAERLSREEPHEMKQLTPVTESLPIGNYYIWSVRTTATSPVDRSAVFTMSREPITLVEK